MGTLFSSVASSTRIKKYIIMKAIFMILLLALFAISLSSSSSLVKRQTSRGRDCSNVRTLVEIPISIVISNVNFAHSARFSLQKDVTTANKELGHAKEGVTLENLFVKAKAVFNMSDIV